MLATDLYHRMHYEMEVYVYEECKQLLDDKRSSYNASDYHCNRQFRLNTFGNCTSWRYVSRSDDNWCNDRTWEISRALRTPRVWLTLKQPVFHHVLAPSGSMSNENPPEEQPGHQMKMFVGMWHQKGKVIVVDQLIP